MTYTFSTELVSDLHKDAFGFRPTADFWDMWNNGLSDEGRQAEWDYMVKAMNASIEEEKLREQYDLEAFENDLSAIMGTHNVDEETALRWMTQTTHIETSQDVEYWVWQYGILFTDRGREIVSKLKKIYKEEK
jgi:hypothetical protein